MIRTFDPRPAAGLLLALLSVAPSAVLAEEPPPPVDPLLPAPPPATARGAIFSAAAMPPELVESAGLRVGNFAIRPSASASALYDDNVNAADQARDEDVLLGLTAGLRAQSLYARHALGFSGSTTAATGIKSQADDLLDWVIGADGRLDLSRQSSLGGNLGYTRERQDANAIDGPDATIDQISSGLGYDYRGQVIGWHLGGTLARTEAEEAAFAELDRTIYGLQASASYRLSDRLALFAGPSFAHAAYDEAVAADGEGRDSDQISASIGASYRVSEAVQASGSIGYARTRFDDPDQDDAGSLIGNAGLAFRLGSATRLGLNASRSLQVTTLAEASSRTVTALGATLSRQVGSAATVSLGADYRHSDFNDLERSDDDLGASIGYARRLSEHLSLNASYRFSRRLSDDAADEYYRNQILVGLGVAY